MPIPRGVAYALIIVSFTACGAGVPPMSVILSVEEYAPVHPECTGTLLLRDAYTLCQHNEWRIADWVAHALTPADLRGTIKRTDNFRADQDLEPGQRSELADYLRSGFDRGHLAPAGDFKRSELAMSESFLLSNISPQHARFNRGVWRNLEASVRERALVGANTWIYTGNLVLDANDTRMAPVETIGDGVVVPTHCFKAVLTVNEDREAAAFAFILPNIETAPTLWEDYQVTVDALEGIAGIDLFSALEDDVEVALEAEWRPL